MPNAADLAKLRTARDKIAEVFSSQVCDDDVYDNGNLDSMTTAIKEVETVISKLNKQT